MGLVVVEVGLVWFGGFLLPPLQERHNQSIIGRVTRVGLCPVSDFGD